MKKWKVKARSAGSIAMAAVFTVCAVGAISLQEAGAKTVSKVAEVSAKDNLKLCYDEPAEAAFEEIFSSKYKFIKWLEADDGTWYTNADGWLELGRSDVYNYTDGKNHKDESKGPDGTWDVTDAVKQGVAWAKHALPVGNGHMGAMSFGRTDTEIIQMNESTLWTGGPGCESKLLSTNNGDVYGNRKLTDPESTMNTLINSAFTEYYSSLSSGAKPNDSKATPYNVLTTNSREQEGAYQSFCEMKVDFNHNDVSDYKRELDLNKALSTVSYVNDDTQYDTELFASNPDDVIVYRVKADGAGKVNFTVKPEIPQMDIHEGRYNGTAGTNQGEAHYGKTGSVVAEGDTITLAGALNHNGMQFAGSFKIVTKGGTQEAANEENALLASGSKDHGSITVKDADEAYVVVSLTTDYVNDFDKGYRTGETISQLSSEMKTKVDTAAAKGFEQLYIEHEKDYSELFDRVKLDIGGNVPENMTTDELIDTYKSNYNKNKTDSDYNKYLETLYYQYGRYLLISSSREGSLPANLQGIWNDSDRPAWSSDFHTNINLQMNYWLAESTNLAEAAIPLVDFANSLRKPGRLTLAKTYGIGFHADETQIDLDTEDGFVFFCSTNPLGFTGNIDSNASFTQTATAFLGQNIYDYYAFTKDKAYLRSDIFPYLRESCVTYLQTLEAGRGSNDADKLYVAPSWSSEQGPWTVGTYFDQQLVWQEFHDTIKVMEDLGITPAQTMADDMSYLTDDSQLLLRLQDALGRLNPVELGTEGQVKEWQQEANYNKTSNGTDLGAEDHRHISQLMALYPGNYIDKENEELLNGAKIVLNKRGDESTGWGEAYRLNLWARTGDGNHAYDIVNSLLATSTYDNLFDTHAPFQIDGNFGATAGITEMLLQSQNDKVELLPALPDAWNNGSVSGLVARGNFEVSMKWKDQAVESARIVANAGGQLVVDKDGIDLKKAYSADGTEVSFTTNANGDYVIDTIAGEAYRLMTTTEAPGPELTETPKPTETETPKPTETETPKPTETETPKPAETETPNPMEMETPRPTETKKPAITGMLGDVDQNNKVDLADANTVLKAALGIIVLKEDVKASADVDKNKKVELTDANLVLKAALGILTLGVK